MITAYYRDLKPEFIDHFEMEYISDPDNISSAIWDHYNYYAINDHGEKIELRFNGRTWDDDEKEIYNIIIYNKINIGLKEFDPFRKEVININKLTEKENKPEDEILFKLLEEVGELVNVRNSLARHSYKNETEDHLVEELSDVIQCAFSYAYKKGIKISDITDHIAAKNKKWEEKYINISSVK